MNDNTEKSDAVYKLKFMLNHYDHVMPILREIWLVSYVGTFCDLLIMEARDRSKFIILKNEINSRSF